MANLMFVWQHIGTPIKSAWLLWLVWTVVQVGWYRRGRALQLRMPLPAAWPRPEPPRPAPVKVQSTEETKAVEKSLSSELENAFGGGFISLGLDERHSPSTEQLVG